MSNDTLTLRDTELFWAIQAAVTGQRPPAAFALVTGADYASVYGAVISAELLRELGPQILDIPFDWDIEFHSPEFERASTFMGSTRAASTPRRTQTQRVAQHFEMALRQARSLPELQTATLVLCCAGADQSWETLARAAHVRLNPAQA